MNYKNEKDIFRILCGAYNSKKQITTQEAWKLGTQEKNTHIWIIIVNLGFSSKFIMDIIRETNNWTIALSAIKTEKLSKAQLMEIIELQGNSSLIFIEVTKRIFDKNYKKRN